jgi:hypothetical protein
MWRRVDLVWADASEERIYPENGGVTFLRNVSSHKIYTAPHSRRRNSLYSPVWKPQILHCNYSLVWNIANKGREYSGRWKQCSTSHKHATVCDTEASSGAVSIEETTMVVLCRESKHTGFVVPSFVTKEVYDVKMSKQPAVTGYRRKKEFQRLMTFRN